MQKQPFPCVLTIAGSDSGGGAGIQADLKTFGALDAYGTTVITAITAQNTQGVQSVEVVPPEMIEAQCRSVLTDINIHALKIGMLPDITTIKIIARVLREFSVPFVVLDPVLVATSGNALSLENTVEALITELFPVANLITPNLYELSKLSGNLLGEDEKSLLQQGYNLLEMGANAVLVKGGHWQKSEKVKDWLLEKNQQEKLFEDERIITNHTHGTGCTLSAAITAYYPLTNNLEKAVFLAKQYITGAISSGQYWHVGKGNGPVNHFWQSKSNNES